MTFEMYNNYFIYCMFSVLYFCFGLGLGLIHLRPR